MFRLDTLAKDTFARVKKKYFVGILIIGLFESSYFVGSIWISADNVNLRFIFLIIQIKILGKCMYHTTVFNLMKEITEF